VKEGGKVAIGFRNNAKKFFKEDIFLKKNAH